MLVFTQVMAYRNGPARESFSSSGSLFKTSHSKCIRRYGKVSDDDPAVFRRRCRPPLERVPGTDLHLYGPVWLLTQGETRKTKRRGGT